jgi:hypothetical protein
VEYRGTTVTKAVKVLHYEKDRVRMGIYGCAFDPNVQSQNVNALCMLGQSLVDHLILIPEGIDERKNLELTLCSYGIKGRFKKLNGFPKLIDAQFSFKQYKNRNKNTTIFCLVCFHK